MDEDKENEEKDIEKFGGIIHPYVKYIYGFLYKYIIKPLKLDISKEFFYFLSFGILTIILFFSSIPIWLPILFFSLAGLDLLLLNGGFFKEKFLPPLSKEIENFFSDIENKRQYDVIKFISYNNLSTKSIIRLLEIPRFNDNAQIYSYIVKKQWIHPELLNYIIENDLYLRMGDDILCKFLKNSISDMSRNNYLKIINVYEKNTKVIRTINYCYPHYLKDHKIFQFFAKIPLTIREFFLFGMGNFVLFLGFFIIYLFMLLSGNLHYSFVTKPGQSSYIFEQISLFVSMILASGILALIFRTIILKFTQGRYILYYFTPRKSNKIYN